MQAWTVYCTKVSYESYKLRTGEVTRCTVHTRGGRSQSKVNSFVCLFVNVWPKKRDKQIANKLDIKFMNSALYCNRGTRNDRTADANTPHLVSQNYTCSLHITSWWTMNGGERCPRANWSSAATVYRGEWYCERTSHRSWEVTGHWVKGTKTGELTTIWRPKRQMNTAPQSDSLICVYIHLRCVHRLLWNSMVL